MNHRSRLLGLIFWTLLLVGGTPFKAGASWEDLENFGGPPQLSTQQIVDLLCTLDQEGRVRFASNLEQGRARVAVHLTYKDPTQKYHHHSCDGQKLLDIFDQEGETSTSLHALQQQELKSEACSYSLYEYLTFCKNVTVPWDVSSGISCSGWGYEYEETLDVLDLPQVELSRQDKKAIHNMEKAFRRPLALTPFDIYRFRESFKALKKGLGLDPDEAYNFVESDNTTRSLAEHFCAMKAEEIQDFCASVGEAQGEVAAQLLHTSALEEGPCPHCTPSRRGRKYIKDAKALGHLFKQEESEKLDLIAGHVLWDGEESCLTLERWLEFCGVLYPKCPWESDILFVRKERFPGHEAVLNALNLDPDWQRDRKARKYIEGLQGFVAQPLQLSPLQIFQFKQKYEKLKTLTNTLRQKSFAERCVDFTTEWRSYLISAGLMSVVGILMLQSFESMEAGETEEVFTFSF